MEVVAFVGPSGTGKSHHAIGVAFDNRCDAIIDDGLLIKGTKILAGTSAKNEDNRIQAVKRAIFTDEGHAQAVREALATNNIHRLLIIATFLILISWQGELNSTLRKITLNFFQLIISSNINDGGTIFYDIILIQRIKCSFLTYTYDVSCI